MHTFPLLISLLRAFWRLRVSACCFWEGAHIPREEPNIVGSFFLLFAGQHVTWGTRANVQTPLRKHSLISVIHESLGAPEPQAMRCLYLEAFEIDITLLIR